jgi:hypothetical protein
MDAADWLLKYSTERRVRARGLHDFLGNHGLCRPGALTCHRASFSTGGQGVDLRD